jgi:hypothetical protein
MEERAEVFDEKTVDEDPPPQSTDQSGSG